MSRIITDVRAVDVRFPTSLARDGSDAMNPDPDYSAAYAIITTDAGDGLEGHGFTFTEGRGNEVCCAAIGALRPLLLGRDAEAFFADMGGFWRHITSDSQLRWLGPEKGVIHLATAAVVNAVWDLFAKVEGKPLWKLLCDMPPEKLADCVDYRYIDDALTREDAVAILERAAPTRSTREAEMRRDGYPAYTTSPGWLGYDDDKVRDLCRKAVADGWRHIKMKVGGSVEEDRRRARLIREEIGDDRKLMMDANQVWGVEQAITHMRALAEFDPWWIEEPTSPDDILGHARIARELAPMAVATGEHVQNRTVFKQLLQADAIRFCQLDACRLGGVNEVIAVLLLAAKFEVTVCPHAGGVGLCEYVQHIALFDYIAVSADLTDRTLEYVDHLHEHFVDPVVVSGGRYQVPLVGGYSAELLADSRARHTFPDGEVWQELASR